jgi:hypothetical protein
MYRFATVVVTAAWVLAAAICSGQEAPNLPEGVTHVALPRGTVKLKRITRNGKPLLRLTAGELVIHARGLYLGDGKHAIKYEATKKGIRWVRAGGKKGSVVGVEVMEGSGELFGVWDDDAWMVERLKPGSVYLTSPSIKIEFKP